MSQRSLREISALLDRFYDEQPDGGADAARAWAESTDGLRDDPLFVDDFVQAVAAGDAGLDGATALMALPSAALPREPAAGDRPFARQDLVLQHQAIVFDARNGLTGRRPGKIHRARSGKGCQQNQGRLERNPLHDSGLLSNLPSQPGS